LGVLGAIGALLSITGIFGMAAYSVSRRVRELGIRLALGAHRRQILKAALGQPFRLLVAGSAAGLILGVLASRVLAFIVYHATPRDPFVLGGVVLVMALLGLARAGSRRSACCRSILCYCCARNERSLKAAVYRSYGPPEMVRIEDVEKPVPAANEVLVRIDATTVCAADWRFRKAEPFFIRLMNGVWRPKKVQILGMEFAGTVESLGSGVTGFAPGEHVFGATGMRFGTHAEYASVPADRVLAIDAEKVTQEQAGALMFGGISALHFLKRANVRAGQNVLVYGASGSVGTFAVQLAKHFGARVTAVCSTANMDLVKSLGADEVVDYTRQDFSSAGRVYDVVFDTVGESGFWRSLRSLRHGGHYMLVGGSGRLLSILGSMLGKLWATLTGAAKVESGMAKAGPGDQRLLKELIEGGTIRTVIDRRYRLAEIAEAHRYVEARHKKGNVVIVP
jgi:NADPH:quinone reductase-like Zn-dependent oxidoreductase